MTHPRIAFSNIALLISAIFFFTGPTSVRPNCNDQVSNKSIKAVFQEYKFDLEKPSNVTATLFVYDFMDGSTTELLKFENVKGSITPVINNNHLLYYLEPNYYLVTLPNKDPKIIATDVRGGMIFSQDSKNIVYLGSQGVLKTYSITSGKTEILGNLTAYEEPSYFIGYDSSNSKIIYLQFDALHEWRKIGGVKVLYQYRKTNQGPHSDFEMNYRVISNDLTKVLFTKENIQGYVSEVGIFDIPKRRYTQLDQNFNELIGFSANVGFTTDSKSLRGVSDEGYGASSYWNAETDSITAQTVFKSSNGFIQSASDDQCRFLIRKEGFMPNKLGFVSFFVEPLTNPSKKLTVYEQKPTGNQPGVNFVGWLTN